MTHDTTEPRSVAVGSRLGAGLGFSRNSRLSPAPGVDEMTFRQRFNEFLCKRIFGCDFWPIHKPDNMFIKWGPDRDLHPKTLAQCRRCGKIMEL